MRAALMMAAVLPRAVARGLGRVLGAMTWNVLRIRRTVSCQNVEASLGGDPRRAARIASASYQFFGRAMMEFAAPGRLRPDALRRVVRVEGLEHLDETRRAGRGAILVTGHFGNWELLGAALAARGYPVYFLVGEQTNARVDRLINALRVRWGVGVIHRGSALRGVLRALRSGAFVAMLADQNVRHDGVFVEFFGRAASTTRGPARFAIHAGCPVIPGFIVPDVHAGGYRATIEPPLRPGSSEPVDRAVFALTDRYTRRIEHWVRRYPDVYFWPHRRWKTRPPVPG